MVFSGVKQNSPPEKILRADLLNGVGQKLRILKHLETRTYRKPFPF
jgi:hypothetical protein